ncbi:sensor histidine kinase [Microbacterium sp. 18062]|uniref:sensor histidine kinase n=1 Tax=Microbacterium sp. 18062 TaxID=2681410 RepID=UPI0013574959|nr:ATP-binding protein [Microbacterium sp. 18062]
MGASSEGADRDLHDSRSRGFSVLWIRSRLLTSLLLGFAVFVGLWLTVTPDGVIARWAQLALGAIAVTGVMVSSRLPLLAVIVTAAATACAWLLGVTADPFVLTGFAVFGLAETRGGRKFPWWMFAGAFVVVVASAIFGAEGAEDRFRGMLLSALVLSVAWVLGVRTREVKREAAARSRAEERLRLARDVHDVLSHSLGSIGVQAGVAAHVTVLGADDLREVLRGIESDVRLSLSELKTLLQLERSDIEADDMASSPLSAALAGVALTAEKAGVAVHLDTEQAIDVLPADVRTTVLRIVQEAVTNVVRHASASSVAVTLRISSEAVTVGVEDDGQGARGEIRPGHGLMGMRERAELLGGTVDFTSSTSGSTVSAAVPLQRRSVGGQG